MAILCWSNRVCEADWIVGELDSSFTVSSLLPSGFDEYIGLAHPIVDETSAGREVRAREETDIASTSIPFPGSLPKELLKKLQGILGAETTRPESCFFCISAEFGIVICSEVAQNVEEVDRFQRVTARSTEASSLVRAPRREYLLYLGPIESASWLMEAGWEQSPNLWWPKDRAWCVATDLDQDWTYIGGSSALGRALRADTMFDVVTCDRGQRLAIGGDGSNGGDEASRTIWK